MTKPNILELAKQGNAEAIASLINRQLQPKGITVKTSIKNDCLNVMTEAVQVPNQQTLVAIIRKGITSLGAASIKKVKVYGRKIGESFPAWHEEFDLVTQNLPELEQLAKQGDANAIVNLINRWLNSPNITVKASLKQGCLQVMLESTPVPTQNIIVPLIGDKLNSLGIEDFKKVKIYAREIGEDFPEWQQEFDLEAQVNPVNEISAEVESSNSIVKAKENNQPSFWGSITKEIANTTSQASNAIAQTATGVGGTIADTALQTSKNVVGKAAEIGGSIANNTSVAGKNVVGKATEIGGAIINTASVASQTIVKRTTDLVTPIVDATGKTIQTAANASTDWLIRIIDKVDIVQAETEVTKLQERYPDEQPRQIAHRLMLDKALLAAGSGLFSNLIPGTAIALAGIDLAATTALSAELVYQIAAAYAQDLQSSERKHEILTIFGLSLSGSLAIEAGVGFLGNIPVAGAAIGASSNAAMIYALGYGACRFYEAKLNPLIMEATLETSQAESQKYLEAAITQETIMDQILVHVVLAGNAGKTWEMILPELQAANLSPASLDAIAANINSPPPLETLLAQIDGDFAIPLLAQCEKIAQLDGIITSQEAQIIEAIANKLRSGKKISN
jgi:uncharacterized protein (DUF697 family)